LACPAPCRPISRSRASAPVVRQAPFPLSSRVPCGNAVVRQEGGLWKGCT
jgi:hypothetical protein